MATEPGKISHAEALAKNYVKPGSQQHRLLIEAGYGISLDDAQIIVKEWEADHKAWPLEEYRKAKAAIEASKATPQVIDKEPGWKRQRG